MGSLRGSSLPRRSVYGTTGAAQLGAALVGAALLVASAAIHLDLYLTGYRTIPVIGWMFLLQVIAGFAIGAGIIATLIVASAAAGALLAGAGALFALATLGGYLLSLWTGLFGFTEIRTTAGIVAGIIEIAAFVALAAVPVVFVRHASAAEPARRPLPARLSAISHLAARAIAAAAVVAAVLLAIDVAAAPGGGPSAPSGPGTAGGQVLHLGHAGGAAVITNAKGLTLYSFAPDTATSSHCTGSCAVYWPPVIGKPSAGPGVTGRLGTITRPDGTTQATYDGHPLYTYISDSAPGQATGNNLNLNGGLWLEITP